MEAMEDQNNVCYKVEEVIVETSSTDFYEASLGKEDVYQISGEKKGLVLILNNSFKDAKGARTGSDLDVANMKELWTQMGCDLYKGKVYEDKTAKEIKRLIKRMNDVGGYCFLVIIIMSHGNRQNHRFYFAGSDGKSVYIDDVLESVNNENSRPDARHIPKFFIFQSCRGRELDKGVLDELDSCVSTQLVVSDASPPEPQHLPRTSNILAAYGTMDGYSALRNPIYGSWFINAITNIFMKHAHEKHVADLLVMVQRNMESMTGEYVDKKTKVTYKCKAMSQHESSLTKSFFLFPGHPE